MMMFIYGALAMWTLLGWFCYFGDNRGTGIQLFGGWGCIVLTLPVIIVIYPLAFIIRPFYKFFKKNKKSA